MIHYTQTALRLRSDCAQIMFGLRSDGVQTHDGSDSWRSDLWRSDLWRSDSLRLGSLRFRLIQI